MVSFKSLGSVQPDEQRSYSTFVSARQSSSSRTSRTHTFLANARMNGRSPEVRTSIFASEEDQMHSSHALVSLLYDDKGRRGCLYGEGEFGRTAGDEGGNSDSRLVAYIPQWPPRGARGGHDRSLLYPFTIFPDLSKEVPPRSLKWRCFTFRTSCYCYCCLHFCNHEEATRPTHTRPHQ